MRDLIPSTYSIQLISVVVATSSISHGQPLRELQGKRNGAGIGIGPLLLTKPQVMELSKLVSRMARTTGVTPRNGFELRHELSYELRKV